MRYALLLSGLVLAALLAAVSVAPAAKPHKNARYYGFEGSETDVSNLSSESARGRVSPSGRAFRRGSSVELSGCRRTRKVSLAGTRIRRNGKFSKSRRRGKVRYKLSGRFVQRDYARISYVLRSGRCKTKRRKVALYEKGVPPFKSCRSQKAKNDVKNSGGRVFEQLKTEGAGGDFLPFTFACLYSTNRRVELGRNWDAEYVEIPRLAAPYVAYASTECGGISCHSGVQERDLRTGKLVRNVSSTDSGLPGNTDRLTDMVLKSNGSLAWIVDIGSGVGSNRQVIAIDAAGRRLLDSGGNIDPESLTLSGSTISWTKSGVSRSASLN